MDRDISVITMVLEASWVVQGVIILLVLASIASWAVIIDKRRLLKRAITDADDFERTFWSGIDLSKFYEEIADSNKAVLGMAGIFKSGYREFGRLRKESGLPAQQLVMGAHRAMNVSQMREVDRLEQNLAFLATVASTSPYVGLFGTVWGIMDAFFALGGVQSATISLVAPYISEALIATAMGLFAAIPAQVAYNRYADQVDRLEVRYDTFMEELSSILERSASRKPAPAASGTASASPGVSSGVRTPGVAAPEIDR
ncbi:MAG: protein TolQ [Gammaproteobacteria bacterium]|nr:protein TolQ [Gammaproteobacteria bacterium]